MERRVLSAVAMFLLFAFISALPITSSAQTATHKPPTAAQHAMKNQKPSKKGVKRGTTNSTRWQVAIRNADKHAARVRAERKGAN